MTHTPTVPPRPTLTDAERERLRGIRALAQQGETDSAARAAREALEQGLRHPFLFNVLAMADEARGELGSAQGHLEAGIELAPDDLGCLHALGLTKLRLERPEEAQALFERVVELKPDFAPALVALGQALEASGSLLAAEARYEAALALQPGNVLAEAGLASVLVRRGEAAAALERAEKVLAVEPNYPQAAMIAAEAEIALARAGQAADRMRALAAEQRLSPVERSLALGIQGDALDRERRTAEAFAAYSASNRMRREHYAPQFGGAQGTLEYARRLREWFAAHPPRDLISALPPEVSTSPAIGHAFLIGFPRSGTTLLEQVLAGHPSVKALEERETLIDAVRDFMRSPVELARLGLADEPELARYRECYWQRVADAGVVAHRKYFIDKHPFNGLKLPIITRLFPEAKILLAVRDPRDVVWSCFRRRFRMSAPYYELLDLESAAALYDTVMDLTQTMIRELEMRAYTVKLESLIGDFDTEVREVCRFLGLEFSAEMRDFSTRARERGVATASGAQLSRGLNAGGVGEWRRYAHELAPVLPQLDRWVKFYGYAD
jgi:tetratricopeptide (TPR) repeat protein